MSPADPAVVSRQLGREPRSPFDVVVRCEHGYPAVIESAPVLEDGTPFPTRFWLTCPSLVADVAQAESVPGWAAGREGPHRNCLHREVAELLGLQTAGRMTEPSGCEPTAMALDIVAAWDCRHRPKCEGSACG
jgi:hypothetical protein